MRSTPAPMILLSLSPRLLLSHKVTSLAPLSLILLPSESCPPVLHSLHMLRFTSLILAQTELPPPLPSLPSRPREISQALLSLKHQVRSLLSRLRLPPSHLM
ncbi:hypothetical protein IWW34DRAFT_730992 [Fusarium oxysporum f. sp. albedinis]|nr:hypothetical protein IWW34DRAFT_730992 [Fusarium oxysporum f. sp. albedinis]